MTRKEITIINKLGLHARAAAKLVSTAARFSSDIRIVRDSKSADAKSIMGVMMLAASRGTVVSVEANGSDETDALAAIERLILDRFGEDE